MRTRSVRFLLPFLSLAACSDPPAAPGRSVVVPRAQPSVFEAIASFDFIYERPADLGLQAGVGGRSLIDAEYAAVLAKGGLRPSRAVFAWNRIAQDPARYLQMAGKVVTVQVQDQPCSSGTAFAVDAAGTLLTNYHVIAPELLLADPQVIAAPAISDLSSLMAAVVKLIGGAAPDELGEQLDKTMLPWLLSHYRCTDVRLHEVRLATVLQPNLKPLRTLRVKPLPEPEWKKSTVPCEVLATGDVFPGKDIAVLRAGSLQSKLISLPLGDSARVVSGTKVFALGFPAAAVWGPIDAESARYRVIAHDGIVDQRLRIEGGWEAFHMTANINHGDSGGPVIDESGQVIAITVAGNNEAAAQNLAIPIAIAKEFLAQARVLPGRSKLTETWYRACDEFQAQRYAKALPLFEECNRLQGGWLLGAASSPGQAAELIDICRAETGGRVGEGPTSGVAYWWKVVCDSVAGMKWSTKLLLGAFILAVLLWLLKAVAGLLGRLGTVATATASVPAPQITAAAAQASEPAPTGKRRAKPRRKRPTA